MEDTQKSLEGRMWDDVKDYTIGISDGNGGIIAKKFITLIKKKDHQVGWTPYYQDHINFLYPLTRSSPSVEELKRSDIAVMLSEVIGHEIKDIYPPEKILRQYSTIVNRIFRDFREYYAKKNKTLEHNTE